MTNIEPGWKLIRYVYKTKGGEIEVIYSTTYISDYNELSSTLRGDIAHAKEVWGSELISYTVRDEPLEA